MKYFLDTEFHEYKKQPKLLGCKIGKAIDTIELISIGIVTEDRKEYYAICNEFDVKAAWDNEWLREHVLKSIWKELNQQMGTYHKTYHYNTTNKFCLEHLKRLLKWVGKTRSQISYDIKKFVYRENDNIHPDTVSNFNEMILKFPIEFYAYYADYDWVVFCWLFGRMIDLPKGFPMYCRDLKQEIDRIDDHTLDLIKVKIRAGRRAPVPVKLNPDYPKQSNEHNALDDARWNFKLYKFLRKFKTI